MPRSSKPNPPSNSTDNSNDSFSTATPSNFPTSNSSLRPHSQDNLDQSPLEQTLSTSSQQLTQIPPSLDRSAANMEQKEQKEEGTKGKGISRSSPSASSSQGDMADTEMEVGSSQPTEEQQSQQPQKKKRTRTLTTPQQAAVLHALLAQSRFPTTQMREEVGRSIGLSARKVQIWFQNQRQKARRPKGQNAPPLTRPPQYGPYTNVPLGSISESSAAAPSSTQQTAFTRAEQAPVAGPSGETRPFNTPLGASSSAGSALYGERDMYSSEGHTRTTPVTQLSGPGVPGSSVGIPGYGSDVYAPSRSTEYPAHPPSPYGPSGSHIFISREQAESQFSTRPTDLHHRRRHAEGDFPVSLPPLRIPRSPSPAAHSAPVQSSSAAYNQALTRVTGLSSAPPILSPPGMQGVPGSSLTHQVSVHIPPPFTLEPRPLWDDPTFSPFHRPSTSSYEQPRTPTHFHHPVSAPIQSSFQLPSLSNLRLHEGSAVSHVTLPPIQSQDDIRSASSRQDARAGPSTSSSYSRDYDRDPSGHHDSSR